MHTFAAPNTFYRTDNQYSYESRAIPGKNVTGDYREPKGVKYRCIFNIVNEDDFVPEVPMKDCNWTKYGRTASISFNANIPIKTIQPRMNERLSNAERFIYVEYKGNKERIKVIVDSFNLMFEDNPDNMRYDAYVFNNDYVLAQMYLTEPNIPLNTKPFQKREMINGIPGQYQMPAYFMNYLSFAMKTDLNIFGIDIPHPEFVNLILHGGGFKFSQMARRYEHAKDIVVKHNNNVKTPHYLETYYILTKSISANDFR